LDTLDAIRDRRSIRQFTGEGVPRADLQTIVDCGRLAASGSNRQPWEFVVVTNRPVLESLAIVGDWIVKAGAVVAVVMDSSSRWWVEDGAAAIENMLLASVALGFGACWVEGDALQREDKLKDLLGVPASKRLMALVPIGVAARVPVVDKKPLVEVLHWEKY
jgi:nitroreductase